MMKTPVGLGEPVRTQAAVAAAARILVVDDEALFAQRLRAEFELRGFVARAVGDGQSALDSARDWSPDLIILDVRMPGMDGIECLRRLRSRDDPTHPPVILLTADESPVVDAAACVYGGCHLLRKPCPREHVIDLAAKILA